MTTDEVMALLPEWTKRLRLQDWDIDLVFAKHQRPLGQLRLEAKYKTAKVTLREPEFIDPDEICSKDLEVTLVHELLHVQAGQLTEFLQERANDRWYDEMERVVELTAIALVNLRRERQNVTTLTRSPAAKLGNEKAHCPAWVSR